MRDNSLRLFSPPRLHYLHHLYALLGYLGLALLMTYPLVQEFARAIPGDGFDGWQNVWNLWWVKRALLVEGGNPYFTRLVDYPQGVYLYFHTLNIFNGLTFLPFTLNSSPLVAYNVAVIFSFAVGGYGAYLLALHALRRPPTDDEGRKPKDGGVCAVVRPSSFVVRRRYRQWAAFLGGVVFAFSPYHTAHLLGHMQLISLEWLPFYALFVIKVIEATGQWGNEATGNQGIRESGNRQITQPSNLPTFHPSNLPPIQSQISNLQSLICNLPHILTASLFLVLIAACDWYYAFYMVLFTGLYLLWTIGRRCVWLAPVLAPRVPASAPECPRVLAPILATAAVGLIFAVITSPVLVPIVRESLQADYMIPPAGSTERLSADLTAFLTPSELHPMWGALAARWASRFTASTSERTVFAGYSVIALALLALAARWRAARFWGLSALIFAVLSLGPVLHVGGSSRWDGLGPIPLPYALLRHIFPLLSISRSVSRFAVMVMLSLSVLAAFGLNWLLSRRRRAGYNRVGPWLVATGALIVVGLEYWVAPYPMSFPETQSFHYQLAREPDDFAVMDIPMDWDRPANLLYQTVHGKPTVSGYTSRSNPLSPAGRMPVLQTFRYLGPDINPYDPGALAPSVLSDLDVRYVIIHKTDLPPGAYRETTLDLADRVFEGWPVVVDDDWLKVFRVPQPASPLPYLALGQGWAPREMHAGEPARALAARAASLELHLPRAGDVELELRGYSLSGPVALEVGLADMGLGAYSMNQQATVIATPAVRLPAGLSLIDIRTDAAPENVIFTRVSLVLNP